MSDDKPFRPGSTEELPTLPRPGTGAGAAAGGGAESDQAPTQEKPGGKIILDGAAAEDVVTPKKTEAGAPPEAPVAGKPVARTMPSEDDDQKPVPAGATKVDVIGAPAAAPTPHRRAPQPSRGSSLALGLVIGFVVLALAGVAVGSYFYMRPGASNETAEPDGPPEKWDKGTAASPAPTPAPPDATTPQPAATPAPTPEPTETASPSTGAGTTTPGPKPSGTSKPPPGAPSLPSWIPTAVPTAFPTAIPTTFPTAWPPPPPPSSGSGSQ